MTSGSRPPGYLSTSTLPWLLLVALIFLATHLDVFPFGLVYDEKRILQILWLTVVLLLAISSPSITRSLVSTVTAFSRTSRYLLIALLFFAALSTLNTHSILHAAQEFFLFFAIAMSILILAATARQDNRYLYLFVSGIVLFNLYYAATLSGGLAASIIKSIPVDWPYPVFGFTNIRFLNQYMVPGFPLVIGVPLIFKDKVHPALLKLYLLFLPIWSFYLFYTGSRGAPLAIILSAIVVGMLYRRHAIAYLKLLIVSLCLGYVLFWLLTTLPGLMGDTVGHQPDVVQRIMNKGLGEQRLMLLSIGWSAFREYPLFGIGPMHFPFMQDMIQGHPHNALIQVLAEWGVINFLLLASLVTTGLYRWVRFTLTVLDLPEYEQDHGLFILLSAAFLSGAIYSMVSGIIVMPLGQLMMMVIIAMMIAVYFRYQSKPAFEAAVLSNRLAVMLLCSSALIGLIYFTLTDLAARATGHVFYLELTPINIGPRFWHFGAIPQP
jgi:O-antigen ligase